MRRDLFLGVMITLWGESIICSSCMAHARLCPSTFFRSSGPNWPQCEGCWTLHNSWVPINTLQAHLCELSDPDYGSEGFCVLKLSIDDDNDHLCLEPVILTSQIGLYTDESPGLKVDPVVVLVLSLVFIFSVVALHSKLFPSFPADDLTLTLYSVIAKVTRKFSS